jgi:large subunit ribosomal protein L30e
MNLVKIVRSAVDSNNVVLGTKETLKKIMVGKVKFVVVASNCEKSSREDLDRYSKMSGTEVKEFEGSSVELGEVCGKPYVVSMLGILNGEESAPKPKRKK